MPVEQNHGLTFSREDVVLIYKDGKLVAIERQPNGHIERHMTKEATKADSMELYDLNKVQTN
jgi:hypothetical protein